MHAQWQIRAMEFSYADVRPIHQDSGAQGDALPLTRNFIDHDSSCVQTQGSGSANKPEPFQQFSEIARVIALIKK